MTKVAAFIERVLLGAGHAQGREDVSRELAVERENLKREHDDLQSARRQHTQIANSSARVLETMTHAMMLMEAPRAGSERQ